MTMIYDPIPFAKLVQKILVGSYEPITRICGKIHIINLHNLQMLFMLRIRHNISECLPPLHNHEGPSGRLPEDDSTQARKHGGIRGQSSSKSLFFPQIVLCSIKLFQSYDKDKNIFP